LDGVSSLWVTTFGHGTPEINDAIKAQLDRLDHATFLGATHVPGIELAERLLATAPGRTLPPPDPDRPGGPSPTDPEGPTDPKPTEPTDPTGPDDPPAQVRLSKVFYAGDGSSAVEVALKMAYQHSVQAGDGTGRPLFLHLQEAYHGDTRGAVSVGGIELFHAAYRPLLLKTVAVGSPGVRKPGQTPAARAVEAAEEMADAMARHGDRVCAIVVEPMVQAAAGMLTYDAHFLRAARRLATRHGALLICDEVATGVGGTGTTLPVEHAGGGGGRRGGAGRAGPREGPHRRVPAAVRGPHHRRGVRVVPRLGGQRPHLLPRPHVHGQPAVLRRRQRQPEADRGARPGG